MSEKTAVITRYSMKGRADIKIALAADLHGHPGLDFARALEAEKPDVIIMAGDMMKTPPPESALADEVRHGFHRVLWALDAIMPGSGEADPEITKVNALEFMAAAARIAPCYFSPGNHDYYLTRDDRRRVRETGTVLLDGESTSLTVNGQSVYIGGFARPSQEGFLRRFASRRGCKIVICHKPERFVEYGMDLDVDATLAGHAHGGQWRLFGRGLFAPGQGFFPKYTRGVYGNKLVVSAGLSNTSKIPRINNPIELVIIEMKRETQNRT